MSGFWLFANRVDAGLEARVLRYTLDAVSIDEDSRAAAVEARTEVGSGHQHRNSP
jgi:hypothetical protein